MSDKDYSHAWRQAVLQYRQIDKNPDDWMGTDSSSQEARAQAVSEISRQLREIANSMKDLKPPADCQELQEQTYLFYRGLSDRYNGYSEALGTGDQDKISSAANGINDFVSDYQYTISRTIKKLNDKGNLFRSSWDDLSKPLASKT